MEVLQSEAVNFPQENKELMTETQISLICPQYQIKSPTDSTEDVFTEFCSGLTNKNWEIRNQTLVELQKLIPETPIDFKSQIVKEILRLVTLNLANIVPYVRRNALDVILAFIKFIDDPELVLKTIIVHGVDIPTPDTNLSLNTIHVIPVVLKAIQERNKTKNISHKLLVQMVTSLSKKMIQITHQRQVISSLLKIKRLIGESMFDHFLETYYPQVKRDFDALCNVYDNDMYSDLSDQSDHLSYTETDKNENQEEIETHLNIDYEECGNSDDDVIMKVYDEEGNEIKRTSSRRVTFGGEIVKIRTPDSDATAITTIKDKVDITADIVIQISSDESLDSGNESISASGQEDLKTERPRSSHIPLPIRPALSKPKHPKSPFKQPSISLLNGSMKQKSDYEILMEIPNYEGESLTSSSDSSDRGKTVYVTNAALSMSNQQKANTMKHNAVSELMKLNITDRIVLENLFKKEDWRFYISGLERLTQILSQREIQNLLNNETTGISLLCYMFNGLAETKNNRVITSSLRALRTLCQGMEVTILALNLAAVIPIFCSYLSSDYDSSIQLETVETLKMLMRKFSPQTVVDFLFTEQCFFCKSSKMRENTLLCLMYALLTFPSTEFNITELAETLIKQAITEPKRRVRQALLDTLSILGQFIPRSQFKIDNVNEETLKFKRALRARLTRRQLPIISPNGLCLYAFQISPGTAFGTDIEWILEGRGSLSDNCSKSKAQFNYAHGDDISLLQIQKSWNDYEKIEPKNYKSDYMNQFQNAINRGNSEEILTTNSKLYNTVNKNDSFERYSADWMDSRYSSNYLDTSHRGYPSNLSDTSSYASSYGSDQDFPKKNQTFESNVMTIPRPVSEDKLDRLARTSKYKLSSKLPIRLEPTVHQVPIHYTYNNSGSLPILTDKKNNDLYYRNYYISNKYAQLSSDSDSKSRWFKNKEQTSRKLKYIEENSIFYMKNKSNNQAIENNCDNDIFSTIYSDKKWNDKNGEKSTKSKIKTDKENTENKITNSQNEDRTRNKNIFPNELYKDKSKKFLEKKVGVKLKRSLTKEIKMPQSTFSININELPPFENPKDGINTTLQQFESNEWETVMEALQGVVKLTRHHTKYIVPCLHTFVIAVAKEIRSLRSQVARAACLSAESIFKHVNKLTNQDIEELSQALFLRTADTNKFLREDSNRALDVMIENTKFSKSIVILTQKVASHPNVLIRATTARLMSKLVQIHGPSKILGLTKEKKEAFLHTVVKFLMDSNLETRNHGKNIFFALSQDKKLLSILSEIVPSSVMSTINKFLSRSVKK